MADMLPIKFLTIHCTATPEGLNCTAQQIADMDIKRFGQESYHHIVTLDGTDHVRLSDATIGAHVGGHNTGNIGVSYVGGLDRQTKKPKDTRTGAQREMLRIIVAAYKAKYPGIVVMGHRDWSPDLNKDGKLTPNEWVKSCPCFDVRTEL